MTGATPQSGLGCELELRMVRAARTGFWPEDLREHASSCPVCTEALAVVQGLAPLAASCAGEALPDPARIWWKAQWLARRQAERDAEKPVQVAQAAFGTLAAAAMAVWAASTLGRIDGPLTAMLNGAAMPWVGAIAVSLAGAAITLTLAVTSARSLTRR